MTCNVTDSKQDKFSVYWGNVYFQKDLIDTGFKQKREILKQNHR